MGFFADYPYWVNALFAIFRIGLIFFILLGFIAPLFLSHIRKLPLIERLLYSWVGLGGIIMGSIFVLTVLHIYDFISLILTLLLISFFVNFSRSKKRSILSFLRQWEQKVLIAYIRFVEMKKGSFGDWLKRNVLTLENYGWSKIGKYSLIISIAVAGALVRLFPILQHAAPFGSGWFSHLDRVKEISLQDYFGDTAEPVGMHAAVNLFSQLIQVSPEMILQISGVITSFFLSVIIYWSAKDLIKNRYSVAPLFGMSIYALTPLLLMPISFDQHIEAASLEMALGLAFITFTIFVRNLRGSYKSPWFYVLSGFVATAMMNLFIAFVFLLPILLFMLVIVPRKNYFRSFRRPTIYLISISITVLMPFAGFNIYHGVDFQQFVLKQLFNVHLYSYFPSLILPLEKLSVIYVLIACGIGSFHLIRWGVKRDGMRDELIFLGSFIGVSFFYIPAVDLSNSWWLDLDQLNHVYALMIAIFASVVFATLLEIVDITFEMYKTGLRICSGILLVVTIGSLIFIQGGLKLSRTNPDTIPDGFMEAYYQIITKRQPYTYATVGPEVQQVMAKNRHYFMEYSYFLSEYNSIDSLYREELELPEVERDGNNIPPASIFVFTEKAPYGHIQQGILYDSPSVMRDVEQWITNYKQLPNRMVEVYYSDINTKVYELVIRPKESEMEDILYDIYPANQ
ncbi:hypothetical protein [Fodinibius sediminis]|uniref:Uncharacterized protein n=1 Tax=Fodinibius sediminis TaxID=1214077 RepID=A0A521DED4_9BACT|nr:hypothetical protein [Fodinibius sediminis]SMO69501.1 hypothetical protein SAMN06265218_109197 [Fodinibius sediminis]